MQVIKARTDKEISISEYLEYIKNNVDLEDNLSIVNSADMLLALANNKDLIADVILALITDEKSIDNPYSEQTIILGGGEGFTVRANVWSPLSSDESMHTMEENLYSYNYAHDHNFSFLTVGLFGPGYETELYTYNYNDCVGYIGEKVDLKYLGREILSKGKVMFYESGIDVHRQLPPKSFSMSLNLLVHKHSERYQDQFEFDTRNATIVGHAPNPSESRNFLFHLAEEYNNQEISTLLRLIGETHPSRRTRFGALKSLIKFRPDERENIFKLMEKDPSSFVRHMLGQLYNNVI